MRSTSAVLLFIASLCCASESRADEAVDRLAVPGPITFDATTYVLSWSSHPSPDYYKQEYLPAGETSDHYQRMVLIDALTKGVTVDGAAAAQVNMLNRRKATDPTVNFAMVRNPSNGEIILDFILSATIKTGETVVEWNAYRYAILRGTDGRAGVVMFGISRRAYGDGTGDFLRGLKTARTAEIKALAAYTLPAARPED